jgi:hypothetical protein
MMVAYRMSRTVASGPTSSLLFRERGEEEEERGREREKEKFIDNQQVTGGG